MPKWHCVYVCTQIHAALTHGGLTEGDVLGGEALNPPLLIYMSKSFGNSFLFSMADSYSLWFIWPCGKCGKKLRRE